MKAITPNGCRVGEYSGRLGLEFGGAIDTAAMYPTGITIGARLLIWR
jgi:hypothetical protein